MGGGLPSWFLVCVRSLPWGMLFYPVGRRVILTRPVGELAGGLGAGRNEWMQFDYHSVGSKLIAGAGGLSNNAPCGIMGMVEPLAGFEPAAARLQDGGSAF